MGGPPLPVPFCPVFCTTQPSGTTAEGRAPLPIASSSLLPLPHPVGSGS